MNIFKVEKTFKTKDIVMFVAIILVFLLIVVPIFNIIKYKLNDEKTVYKPIIISHRGAAGLAPENTIVAVDTGINHKADYIEIDIRQTKDGELIIMHDKSVDRTTNGKGNVSNLSLEQILKLDAGILFPNHKEEAKVPTLEEVLKKVKTANSKLLIEIKDPKLYPNLILKLTHLVNESDMKNKVLINSFDHDILEEVRKNLPKVKTGVFILGYENISNYKGVEYICPSWYSILYFPSIIKNIHKKGCKVFVWTVDNPIIIKYLISNKVDGIITDRPDVLEKVIKEIDF